MCTMSTTLVEGIVIWNGGVQPWDVLCLARRIYYSRRVLTIIGVSNQIISSDDLVTWPKSATQERMGVIDT